MRDPKEHAHENVIPFRRNPESTPKPLLEFPIDNRFFQTLEGQMEMLNLAQRLDTAPDMMATFVHMLADATREGSEDHTIQLLLSPDGRAWHNDSDFLKRYVATNPAILRARACHDRAKIDGDRVAQDVFAPLYFVLGGMIRCDVTNDTHYDSEDLWRKRAERIQHIRSRTPSAKVLHLPNRYRHS